MNSVLYVFITCQSRFNNCYDRINKMMTELNYSHYIIVKGGYTEAVYYSDARVLDLDCNDFYEGLPEKVLKSIKFISESESLNKYEYICKVDDDVVIDKLLTTDILSDFCGNLNVNYYGSRSWHIGRCSQNSKFNTTEYSGIFVPWCHGGNGYVLSKKAIDIIKNETGYYNEIYEDLYIAKILYNNNIFPKFINIRDYIYAEGH
jgi:hypothetical protein